MKEDKKRQAEAISAWEVFFGLRHNKPLIYVSNASRQPIHDVMISYGVAMAQEAPTLRVMNM